MLLIVLRTYSTSAADKPRLGISAGRGAEAKIVAWIWGSAGKNKTAAVRGERGAKKPSMATEQNGWTLRVRTASLVSYPIVGPFLLPFLFLFT